MIGCSPASETVEQKVYPTAEVSLDSEILLTKFLFQNVLARVSFYACLNLNITSEH